MDVLKIIVYFFEVLFIAYFGFAALYVFIFALAGVFKTPKRARIMNRERKFAVLIPGYKEDNVIVEVAQKALRQEYPKDLFEVVVIADSFEESTLKSLRKLPLTVLEVSFDKSTKSKALNKAMRQLGDDYQVALVLDADNIMASDFVSKINDAFNKGFKVVQGHRMAKNTNTAFAILDAISEEVNNHIFRKGHRVMGLSSALIGSGMAFDYHFFKKTMSQVNAVGGFDKELELKLLKDRNTIEYLADAYVLDEKVQKTEVFSNQRKRWLSAQFVYFGRYATSGVKELFLRGNIDFADKVYQMVSPPRILLLGMVVLISLLYLVFDILSIASTLFVPSVVWYTLLVMTVLSFVLSIPHKFYNRATLRAVFTLPRAFGVMFLSLFKLRGANKKFIHTQHGTIKSN